MAMKYLVNCRKETGKQQHLKSRALTLYAMQFGLAEIDAVMFLPGGMKQNAQHCQMPARARRTAWDPQDLQDLLEARVLRDQEVKEAQMDLL
ncbi:UNVERIFIED_CONTAM: hypothetical protein K2H54_004242 [Gekko kuhli]